MTHILMGPVLAQVGLTLVALLALYATRLPAMIVAKPSNEVMQDPKSLDMLPKTARFIAANYNHQFEAPVLFYVLCLGAMIAGLVNDMTVTLAWAYVGLRVLHAAIHMTYNRVMHRFMVFVLSSLVLIALFINVAMAYWGAA